MFKFSFILFILFNTFSYSEIFNVSTTSELETALSTSTNNNEDDTILLADGTYVITSELNYRFTDGFDITLEGSNADTVILDGQSVGRIMKITGNSMTRINNISFIRGVNRVDYQGGALYINNAEINGCIFNGNHANGSGGNYAYGGAIFGNNLSINNSIFTSNSATGNALGVHVLVGGAIYSTGGYLYVNNSTFDSNYASGRGGAIFSNRNDELILMNCTFTKNRTLLIGKSNYTTDQVYGGGAIRSLADTTMIFGSIFSENDSKDDTSKATTSLSDAASDAIYAENNLYIANSLFSKHDKAIYIADNAYVVNSIFYKNFSNDFYADTYAGLTLYNNFVNLTNSYMVTPNSDFSNNVYSNFELGFLDANNGDYRLTNTSDLINAGVNTIPEYDISTLDIDGNPRIIGASMDIGPYEYQTDITPYSDMTYTEKLVEAIKPEYYDDLIALIESEKNDAVANAVVSLTQSDIDALSAGWHNIANPTQIIDMSIFVNVQTVWIYQNGTWSAYSPNTSIANALIEAGISRLTSIDANSAMWIER